MTTRARDSEQCLCRGRPTDMLLTLDFCPWKIPDSKIDPTARKFYSWVQIRAVRASIKHHAVGNHKMTETARLYFSQLRRTSVILCETIRYGNVILSESITLSGQRIIQESALCANRHMNKVIRNEVEL